jgi:hypothetical protein
MVKYSTGDSTPLKLTVAWAEAAKRHLTLAIPELHWYCIGKCLDVRKTNILGAMDGIQFLQPFIFLR